MAKVRPDFRTLRRLAHMMSPIALSDSCSTTRCSGGPSSSSLHREPGDRRPYSRAGVATLVISLPYRCRS
jgi:hypothetical protein